MKLHSILLASALLAAAPAHAATYIITYTGTVYDSYDQTGVFGGSGNSLDGLDYTAVYTLTAPLLGAILGGDGSTYAGIAGGTSTHGSPPSPISAKLTINGTTQEVAGDYQGYAYQYNEYLGVLDQITHDAQDSQYSNDTYINNRIYNNIYSYANNFTSNIDYASFLPYTVQIGDYTSGNFYFRSYTGYVANGYDAYAYGDLRPTSVTITALAGAVPEPATWALMILGFGLLGGVMRQQRRKVRVGYG